MDSRRQKETRNSGLGLAKSYQWLVPSEFLWSRQTKGVYCCDLLWACQRPKQSNKLSSRKHDLRNSKQKNERAFTQPATVAYFRWRAWIWWLQGFQLDYFAFVSRASFWSQEPRGGKSAWGAFPYVAGRLFSSCLGLRIQCGPFRIWKYQHA